MNLYESMCYQYIWSVFCFFFCSKCDKSTALHSACTQGATEAVKVMLSACGSISDVLKITDGSSQTPLHKYNQYFTHSLHTVCVSWKLIFSCLITYCMLVLQGSHFWSSWTGRISHLKCECKHHCCPLTVCLLGNKFLYISIWCAVVYNRVLTLTALTTRDILHYFWPQAAVPGKLLTYCSQKVPSTPEPQHTFQQHHKYNKLFVMDILSV